MMKLKHLFNNEDLAKMLLSNWEYDINSLDLFKYYRISANAVYPFRVNNKICFLRFAASSEKSIENTWGELEFIRYLNNSGYTSLEVELSKNKDELEIAQTPWGEYFAVVFKGVPGVQINKTGFDDGIVFGYGQSLGKLHRLSSGYVQQKYKRQSWNDVLDWICTVLSDFPDETLAAAEARLLKDYFSALPITDKNYGLIHYDFETDNVFYDAEHNTYHPIDFDDAMYHWFAADIEQSIDSMKEDIEQERYEHASKCFIDGYRTQFDISDDMLAIMPVFRRFANLYGYARILRSTSETWNNEPEWMVNLRGYLNQLLNKRRIFFGESI